MNATMEQLTIETEITRGLREQRADLPAETKRLAARIEQLKAQRDPLAAAVQLLRVRVRAGIAKSIELDRAVADLEQLDAELRGVEVAHEESASTSRIIEMELAEQLARRRATVGPQLTAEAKRAIAAISEGLAALQPHVDALLALRPVVAQFDRGVPHPHGYTVYHRELNAEVVRAVNFFTKDYHCGCDIAAVRERWQTIADAVK
jgi:hypothetical protein